jgi:signal recognition particle subunit SRP54
MFQVLGSRLQDVFGSLRREVRLTPEAVERTLREIRLALLEADVNFKVVKAFIDRVRDRATERAVLDSLTPSQQVVAIVRDELLRLFGESPAGLATTAERPQVVLLVGLQGSGKTTTTAKLGRWLTGQGRHPILVSTDVRRPAAIEQLAVLGRDAGLRVHDVGTDDPVRRATSAVSEARQLGFDVVLVDTAGRLHVDDELMQEIVAIRDAVTPSDLLFVADAMTGQDAVRSAGEFNHRLGVNGVVLTKLDGDARGGAALSVVSVVGVPVTFAATGERMGDLEPFRPERLVSRLLGMGDVLSLVERAEQAITGDDAASMATRMRRNELTLDDLKQQMRAVGRMGPLNQVLGMIPGLGSRIPEADVDASALTRMVAIIDSMTAQERRSPAVMNGSRRRRVARGSGTTVQDVNRLLRQFAEMRKMLKTVGGLSRRKGQRRRMALPTMR